MTRKITYLLANSISLGLQALIKGRMRDMAGAPIRILLTTLAKRKTIRIHTMTKKIHMAMSMGIKTMERKVVPRPLLPQERKPKFNRKLLPRNERSTMASRSGSCSKRSV